MPARSSYTVPLSPVIYAEPPALLNTRRKYRTPPGIVVPTLKARNIMFDRRVIRGSTYPFQPLGDVSPLYPQLTTPVTYTSTMIIIYEKTQCRFLAQVKPVEVQQHVPVKRKQRSSVQSWGRPQIVGPPPAVFGRKHEHVQTEQYLEELLEHPPSKDQSCQTLMLMDRPDSPIYVPAKTGIDVETQILPGELFDFDHEVLPILEVLIGKTLEQSLLEVLEEEEMAELRAQQQRFLARKCEERLKVGQLEEQERRLQEEVTRRTQEFRRACMDQTQAQERVAAAVLTRGYLRDLLPSVLSGLEDSGVVLDEVRVDVEEGFMPWLQEEVQAHMGIPKGGSEILREMIRTTLIERANVYKTLAEEEEEKEKEATRVRHEIGTEDQPVEGEGDKRTTPPSPQRIGQRSVTFKIPSVSSASSSLIPEETDELPRE
uniref:Uncharacterized protein n=1 Tax=Timema tahoe TaxID=61484 RepID=A0A7R9IET6_9NEOP|nr:unnamed protein product [Timema tahoe]